jgi:hypothetical protein
LRASRRGPGPARRPRASMRPPRFRRIPFVRDGVLDRGRASTPRITAPHMLPSTGSESLGLCDIKLSWLNSPPRTITVYASSAPSPIRTQHSLPGGPLRPYPCGTCPRWNAPASPGAPGPDSVIRSPLRDRGTRLAQHRCKSARRGRAMPNRRVSDQAAIPSFQKRRDPLRPAGRNGPNRPMEAACRAAVPRSRRWSS